MRIAFVTPEYVTEKNFDGGLASHLARVCPALVQLGHEVTVLVSSEERGTFVRDGVRVHRVATDPARSRLERLANRLTLWRLPGTFDWLLKSRALNRALARLHRQTPFDLVQYASYTATAFCRERSIPAVVRISSYEALRQQAYSLPDTLDHRLMARLDLAAIRKGDDVFCPSLLIAEVVRRETGRPVRVIEPPFSLQSEGWNYRPYRELLEGKRYLLFFGTVGVLKGALTIAEVLEPLLERHPDLLVVFIGKDGGYQGRPMMQHVWEQAGLCRGRILYLGQMRHHELHPILSHATAVLLPSLIDNLPNSCLEAMALQRVVIGTRGASFEQLIDDGESGFLCERGSAEGLLAAIERALGLTEQERSRIGERAARRIGRLHPEAALGTLLEFYGRVIREQGRLS